MNPEKVVGSPFNSIESAIELNGESTEKAAPTNLRDFLVASSIGEHRKISIRSSPSESGAIMSSTECLINVTPVVARESEASEVMAVEYFSLELFSPSTGSVQIVG